MQLTASGIVGLNGDRVIALVAVVQKLGHGELKYQHKVVDAPVLDLLRRRTDATNIHAHKVTVHTHTHRQTQR